MSVSSGRLVGWARRDWGVLLLLTVFLLVGMAYNITTPLFEAPDEIWHFCFVEYLATGGGLPIYQPGTEPVCLQEGFQPPLYYVAAAPAVAALDTSRWWDLARPNPHAAMGLAGADGNNNVVLHIPEQNQQIVSASLAVHATRFLSLLCGMVTVVATYLLAREMLPASPALALGAAALVAFNPQFLFIHSSVSNDPAVTALCSLALLLAVRVAEGDALVPRLVGLGLTLGAAALTKLNALPMLGVAGLAIVIYGWQARSWRRAVAGSLLCFGLAGLVGGWWYARNLLLYGDPLAQNVWYSALGQPPVSGSLQSLLSQLEGLEQSYWGVFGWMNVVMDQGVYDAIRLVTRVAIAGLAVGVVAQVARWRRSIRHELGPRVASMGLAVVWLSLLFAMLLRYMQTLNAAQGRLLFPSAPVVGVLLMLGLSQLVPRRFHAQLAAIVSMALLGLAVVAPFRYIAPAYAQPAFLADSAAPIMSHSLDLDYGDQMRLLGYDAQGTSCGTCRLPAVYPGENISLTLYWQALQPMQRDYSIFIHLHERTNVKDTILAQTDSYPGGGALPTSLWKKGDRLADRFSVSVPASASVPALLELRAGLYDYPTRQRLKANDQQGTAAGDNPLLGRIKLLYGGSTGVPLNFQLGRDLSLLGYEIDPAKDLQPGGLLRLTLFWRANAMISTDYTSFVHLEDNSGHVWAQADHQPVNGLYPTSVWDAGELIRDEYEVVLPADLPPGGYRLLVGMYLLQTLERLPVRDVSGAVVLNDAIPVATVRIAEP